MTNADGGGIHPVYTAHTAYTALSITNILPGESGALMRRRRLPLRLQHSTFLGNAYLFDSHVLPQPSFNRCQNHSTLLATKFSPSYSIPILISDLH
jgi:hypothetical protein